MGAKVVAGCCSSSVSLGLCRHRQDAGGKLLMIWCDKLSTTKVVVVMVMLF